MLPAANQRNTLSVSLKPAPNLRNSALLVIDLQQALFDRPVPLFQSRELLFNLNQLSAQWARANRPVVYVQHANKKMLMKNTPGWKLHPGLHIVEGAHVVHKTAGDAFIQTNLAAILKNEGIDTVVVAGLVSQGCVQATCRGARKCGFHVILVADGHSNYRKDAQTLIQEWNLTLSREGALVLSTQQLMLAHQ